MSLQELEKLKIIFREKVREKAQDENWHDYFDKLEIETKYGAKPYEDRVDFVHISLNVFKINWPNKWHIKIPIETAKKILVLGLP